MAVVAPPTRYALPRKTSNRSSSVRSRRRVRAAPTQAEAAVSQDTGLSVGVRLGEVETLEHQRDRSMGITVYFGQRKGSASTADFSLEAVRATVAKACSIARFTAEDACSGLADAALMARSQPESGPCPIPGIHRRPRDRNRQILPRRRRSHSIRGSTTPRAHRSTPTKDCMFTAIPTASSAAIRPPRIP